LELGMIIPKWMESHRIPWFQSAPTRFCTVCLAKPSPETVSYWSCWFSGL
jgi:hypothetical protein